MCADRVWGVPEQVPEDAFKDSTFTTLVLLVLRPINNPKLRAIGPRRPAAQGKVQRRLMIAQ
jgi:hypothetical protein